MKICVYAIAKNEEQFVQRFMHAAADADMILVMDTGSTDATIPQLRAAGRTLADMGKAQIFLGAVCITPWRFDLARNAALALVPKDIDVCVSVDLDEELQPGWREEIEKVWKLGETTRLRYMFDWGVGIKFYYEKIHARHGYHWHHPCHEYPRPDGRIKEVYAQTDMLLLIHKPNGAGRPDYLDLLKLSVEEDPFCPRNAFYYARELSFHKKWDECIAQCHRYLALPGATWKNERCYAYRVMGRAYWELGFLPDAEVSFMRAAWEAPRTREPWAELSQLVHDQQRWAESLAYALRGLEIKNREAVYTVDPEVWGHKLHNLAALSCWFMGMYDEARRHGQNAFELSPLDGQLALNLEYYKGKVPCSDSPATANSP